MGEKYVPHIVEPPFSDVGAFQYHRTKIQKFVFPGKAVILPSLSLRCSIFQGNLKSLLTLLSSGMQKGSKKSKFELTSFMDASPWQNKLSFPDDCKSVVMFNLPSVKLHFNKSDCSTQAWREYICFGYLL